MKTLPNIDLLKESLSQTKKAIVIMGNNPNYDTVASALGFALVLRGKGIDTQVVSLADMRVEFSRLVGIDGVRRKIGNRNLVVSFEYSEDQVEKVSYQISDDGKRFNLVIAPKSGVAPLQPESVQYEFAGAEAQFIASFGLNSAQELDELVKEEHGLLDSAMTLAVTLFPSPPFAKCHLDASGTSSLSELTANICLSLGFEFDEDSGSNLLAGIDVTSQGFRSPLTTADTFDVVSTLMRAGAVRPPMLSSPQMSPSQMPYMPNFRPQPGGFPVSRPYPQTPTPPREVGTNKFASILGGAGIAPGDEQPLPPPPTNPAPPSPQFPGEFKG